MTTTLLSRSWVRGGALALAGLLAGTTAHGQALNYAASNAVNVAGTFADLGATGTAIATANTDDANSAAQNIGFTFSFNGISFTQFVLSTNGLIKLGATAPSATNLFFCNVAGCTTVSPVTSIDPADVNLVMPFNFDLEPGTGGAAEYRVLTTGASPNRVCTVQWKNVKDKADATPTSTQYDNFTFQAKLYETTNNIEFVYGTAVPSAAVATSRFPVVGIKGAGSASGQTVLASKTTGAAPWTATTFITGNYTGSTHNFRNVSLPDVGRTYRFVPGTAAPTTPPANDNCSGAIVLTIGATCTPVTGDNTNGTASPATVPAPGACAGPSTGATNDIWYRVVVPANGNVTVTTSAVTGSGFSDSVLQLFSGTCGSLTEIGCSDDISATDFFSTVSVTGQTPGATLYARVMGYSTATPNGPIGICATGAAPVPTCADPTAAQIGSVTATSAQITFTAGAGNVSYNVTYTPTGGTATTVTPNPTASPITISGLTASTGYTITIQSVCAAGATGAVLSGTFTTLSGLPAPANDDPTGAVVLPVSTTCTPTNSTNVASTTTTANGYTNPPGGGCGAAFNPKDVWFSFTATSAAATITVTGNPAGMVRTFSAASSAGPFTQVGCAAGTTNNMVSAPLVLTGLTAGTVYYVSVSGYGSNDTQGAFTICVTGAGPATCNPVTNLAATSTNNGTGANVTFTPSAGAISYTVTYQIAGAAATTVTPNPTASPVVLSRLTPSRPYLVTVTANCAAGQSSAASSTSFRTVLAAREALGNGSLSVFPNPAQSAFTLTLPALAGERTASVTLLNALGQAVYTRALELNAAGTQARVDVSALAKGIYTLQVKTNTQTATKSVVVE